MNMNIMIKNRDGELEPINIVEIQEKVISATNNILGVDRYELESSLKIEFYNGITSEEIQNTIVKCAIEKTDIDQPNWTFVAARAFLSDCYHKVGKLFNSKKGYSYSHTLKDYLEYGVKEGRINNSFFTIFDLEELNSYIQPERDKLFQYLGVKATYDRYLLKNKAGQLFELPQHMFMAIAMFLAQEEKDFMAKAKEFYDAISTFEVMVATPTLSNARTNRNQLSSCFQGVAPDNIEGIFDSYKDMGLLSKFGGGIGWDWSEIRASNSNIDDHKGVAGGLIPWLKITNDIALGVDQLGTRKGAIAVYIEPWHMDILDFLDLKKNSGEERRRAHDLFPALWIPKLFLDRAEQDLTWTLFDPYETGILHELDNEEFEKQYLAFELNPKINKKTMSAKELWKKIILSYYESGSPFLGFKDEANRRNQNKHKGKIKASNLCTEIFQNTKPNRYAIHIEFVDGTEVLIEEENDIENRLLNGDISVKKAKKLSNVDTIYHENSWKKISFVNKVVIDLGETLVCNLASVNLSKVNSVEDMKRVVPIAIRMLDNVIDLNLYPIKQALKHSFEYRAIGLGVMGEAQMIAESKITWGTQQHLEKIDEVMEAFSFYAIEASAKLAEEKGSYNAFEGSNWSKGILPIDTINENVKELTSCNYKLDWDYLRNLTSKGMRNGYLMAVAPTSTISIVTGTTQAIEPVYKRKWFEENLSGLIPVVAPNLSPETWEHYVPAYELDQLKIIKAAAVRQKWLDQGQSVNVFMRRDKANGKYLNDIYMLAAKLGLKSTYYLRSESPEETKVTEKAIEKAVDRSMECSGCQ